MSRRTVFALVLALVALGIVLRVAHVRQTLVVVDEFEHLHSAYLVSRGQTPYVDFFEHHPPLGYYLVAATVPMQAPTFDTIIHARYLALVLHGLTILAAAL